MYLLSLLSQVWVLVEATLVLQESWVLQEPRVPEEPPEPRGLALRDLQELRGWSGPWVPQDLDRRLCDSATLLHLCLCAGSERILKELLRGGQIYLEMPGPHILVRGAFQRPLENLATPPEGTPGER